MKPFEPDRLRVDSFELRIADVAEVDPDRLHALSVAVRWPYRADEWRFLSECGRGVVALDEIARVVGTAMLFPHGNGLVTLGMVIVSPRLQAKGVASWMVRHLVDASPECPLVLNATAVSKRLFSSLGFEAGLDCVFLCRGKVRLVQDVPPPAKGARIERLDAGHLAEAVALDRLAFGAARMCLLERLLRRNTGYGLFREGRLKAFAIRRVVGRGHVIGPVVAENDEDAIAVVARHFADLDGMLVRLDMAVENGPFAAFLARSGIVTYETLSTMSRGGGVAAAAGDGGRGPMTFGLINPALG